MMLAAATHSGKISSNFLLELQKSLVASLSSLKLDAYNMKVVDQQLNLDRLELLKNYADQFNSNALTETLLLGLNPSQIQGLRLDDRYKDFGVEFYNSRFLKPKLTQEDEFLRSTLLTRNHLGSLIDLDQFHQKFIVDSKLQISSNLLELLVNSNAYEILEANQELFAIQIDDSGLDLDDLVNAIAISIQAKAADKEEDKLYQVDRYATSQLRLISSDKPTASSLTLNLFTVPVKSRTFVYDATKPISATNPIRIVTRRMGGYNSLYFEEDGHLHINVGSIATKLNGLKPLPDQKKYFNSSFYNDDAVLSNDDSNDNLDETQILDIFPRGRTRYTTTDQSFKIREFTIPPGFILVGIRKGGNTSPRPDLNEFGEFRVYNPETGFLVSTFNQADIRTASCARTPCVDFTKFYTPKKTYELGARVYSSFSTRDLFPALKASKAVDLWLNMQIDLSLDTIFDINSPKEYWQKLIFKSLTKQQKTYLSHIVNYSDTTQINSIFQFTEIPFEKMDSVMKTYYLAEIEALKTYIHKIIDGAKVSEVKKARKLFDIAKKNFDDYVRLKI